MDNILYPIVVAEKAYNNVYEDNAYEKYIQLNPLSTKEFPYWSFYLRPIEWEDYKVNLTITPQGKFIFVEWTEPVGSYQSAWIGCIINGIYRFSKITSDNYILLDNYAFMPGDRIDIIVGFWIQEDEKFDETSWNYDTTQYAYFDRNRPQAFPINYDSVPNEFYDFKCNFYDVGKILYYCGDYDIPTPPPTLAFHKDNVYSAKITLELREKTNYLLYKNRNFDNRDWNFPEFDLNFVNDENIIKFIDPVIIDDRLFIHWKGLDYVKIDGNEYDVVGYKLYVNIPGQSSQGTIVYDVGDVNIYKILDLEPYEYNRIVHIGILYDDGISVKEINNQYNTLELMIEYNEIDVCSKNLDYIPEYLREDDNLVKEYLCAISEIKEVIDAQIKYDYEVMAIKDLPSLIETRLIYPANKSFLTSSIFKFRGTRADIEYIKKILNDYTLELREKGNCEVGTDRIIDLDDPNNNYEPSGSGLKTSRLLLENRLHACVTYVPLGTTIYMADELDITGEDEFDVINRKDFEDNLQYQGSEELLLSKELNTFDNLQYQGIDDLLIDEKLNISDNLQYQGVDDIIVGNVLYFDDVLQYQGTDDFDSLTAQNRVPFTYDLPINRAFTFDAPSGAGYIRDSMQNVDVQANWDDDFLEYTVTYV